MERVARRNRSATTGAMMMLMWNLRTLYRPVIEPVERSVMRDSASLCARGGMMRKATAERKMRCHSFLGMAMGIWKGKIATVSGGRDAVLVMPRSWKERWVL